MIETILLFTLRQHARVRADVLAPLIEHRERCQIRI